MSKVTLQSLTVPGEFHGTYATPLVARLEAAEDFVTSEGDPIQKGSGFRGFGQEFDVSIDGDGIMTIAGGDAYATTNSPSDPNVRYKRLAVYDAKGRLITQLYKQRRSSGNQVSGGLKIPYNVSPTNFEACRIYTEGAATVVVTDMDLVNDLIQAQIDALGASLVQSLSSAYGNDLAAAVATIGSTPTTLLVDANTTVSTVINIPATLVLKQENNAKITIATGGQITFAGIGVVDPLSQNPFFAVNPAALPNGQIHNTPVNTSTDVVTTDLAHGFVTGQQLRYFVHPTHTVEIGGLKHGRTYYAIVLSSTTFKVATSYANALAATAINLTSAGDVYGYFIAQPFAWVGSQYPPMLSSELVDTGDNSISTRAALMSGSSGSHGVTIYCYAGRIATTFCVPADSHSILNASGEHDNTFDVNTQFFVPWYMGSDSYFTSEPGAIIYTSSVYGRNTIVYTRSGAQNAHIIGNHFKDGGAVFNGSDAVAAIVNGDYCSIRDNWFDGCQAYHCGIIADGYTLNLDGVTGQNNFTSDHNVIDNNLMTGYVTQMLFVISGNRPQITNNRIILDGLTVAQNCSLFDFEPNTQFDKITEPLVKDNYISVRNMPNAITRGIHFQSIYTDGIQGGSIEDNTILIQLAGDSPTVNAGGIIVDPGASDVAVVRNTISGAGFLSIDASMCRRITIEANRCKGGVGTAPIIISSLAESVVRGNDVAAIEEFPESFQFITSDGSHLVTLDYPDGSPIGAAWQWMVGLKVLFNETLYTIATVLGNETNVFQRQLTTSPAFPANIAIQTIGTAGVDIAGNEFTTPTNHLLVSGDIISPANSVNLPAATPALNSQNYFYVIKTANNKFKLATTHALALAGTCDVDITSVGVGSNQYVPGWLLRFGSTDLSDNRATSTLSLDPSTNSQILSTAFDDKITSVADADHTATISDGIIVFTSLTAPRTVPLLPAASLKGKPYSVKDGCGGAGAHNITIDPNGAETIDGASTLVISSNWGELTFKSDGANWFTLDKAAKVVRGTVAIDPASINANTVASQTFTLTGAVAGDTLVLNPPAAGLTAGLLVLQAFVSAANTITIVFQNTTGAPIDEPSGNWTYRLER